MDLKDIKSINDIPNILLLFGNERLLLEEYYDKLISILISSEFDNYNFDVRNSQNIDIEGVVNICNSYPMMGDKRVVVVKDFEVFFEKVDKKNKEKVKKIELFQKYLESPQKSTYLVLIGAPKTMFGISSFSPNTDKYKKIEKSLKFPFDYFVQKKQFVEFNQITGNNLLNWIKNRFKSYGKTIDNNAAELLIVQNNSSLRDIVNEIDKINLYLLEKDISNISTEVINSISGNNTEITVFDFQNKIIDGNLNETLNYLYILQKNSKNGILIVNVLSKFFIALLKMYEIDLGGDKFSNSSIVGISPYFYENYLKAKRMYSEEKIKYALKTLAEIDYKLKSTTENETFLIEKFLINTMS